MVLTYLSRRYSRYRQDVWCYDDFPPRGTYTPASVFFPKRFSLNFLRLVFIFIITFFRVIIIKSKSAPAQYFHTKSNIMSVSYLKSIKSFLKNIAHSQPISCLLKTQTFFWPFFNGPLILDVTHFGTTTPYLSVNYSYFVRQGRLAGHATKLYLALQTKKE